MGGAKHRVNKIQAQACETREAGHNEITKAREIYIEREVGERGKYRLTKREG